MTLKYQIAFILILLFTSTNVVFSQNSVIRGVVTDRQSGQTLDRATISVQPLPDGELKGTTTDQNGFYQIGNLDAGEYLFQVRYVGFETYSDTISVSRGSNVISRNVSLTLESEELEELTVSDRSFQGGSGQVNVRPEFFDRAPSPGGNADLVSYIQTQPGVLVTGDRGGQLFVRGGLPSENLILMDGTMIYQPFHIVGFFSVFPENVVSSADFYAGGFGPRYSGRVSSVMDVRLRNGDLYERGWSASVSPFISDFYFETPVKEGKSSLMVSVRGSLIEESSKWYLQEQQPLKFNSQLAKFNSVSNTGVSCSFLMMRTYDRGSLDFDSDQYFKWNNFVTGGRCAGASESTSLSFMELNFGLSYFSNETDGGGSGNRFSNIFRSNLDMSFTHYWSDTRIDYGFFTNYRTVKYDLVNRFSSLDANEASFLSTGGFLNVNIPLWQYLNVEPGFSFTSYMNRVPTSFEPRLRFSLDVPGRYDFKLHGAAGIYRQPLIGLSDFRDAGTAFTAWIIEPDSDRSLQTTHFLLGFDFAMSRFLKLSVEGYHKIIQDTPVSVWSSVAEFTTDIAYANGNVNGFDLRLDYDRRNFFAGLGYGYAITEYETAQDHFTLWFGEEVQTYNPSHDRRHQLNAQVGLEFGNFSTNLNWSYGSGMPFTRPIGFDSFFSFEEGPPEVTEGYGTPRILLDKPFQGRMPEYHRLDVSLEHYFDLDSADLNVQLGAINLYDQSNLFYYDVFFQRGINQLPFVPYLSLKLSSK
ncbi:TonB-dependent receptor [Rhodohalobacter sp.]|uniref:TonB-dependent receptor n=1 Tax=Rhodohalobacter sp. TaxID=1974210 RepID=UPI002ACE335C|nr:TonB-dependent receptor [Rhodohalobacter sp.]MDZ7755384.1 TonB-dependent receptor [Rhodohalobacter sp.]